MAIVGIVDLPELEAEVILELIGTVFDFQIAQINQVSSLVGHLAIAHCAEKDTAFLLTPR